MGCCNQRAESIEQETKQTKEPNFDYQTEDSSTEQKANIDTTLFEYIKLCREKHNWEVICTLISNKQTVFDIKPSPSWTFRPRTIGCLALHYLSKALKRFPDETLSYISSVLPELIEIISSGTSDKAEQSVLIIRSLVLTHSSSIKETLIALNFFPTILPHFLSEKFEFRQLCANLCARIYKNSSQRQKEFIKAEGVNNLIQVISMGPLRGRYFSELIQCAIDLIEDEAGMPSQENIKCVITYIDWNMVNNIDISLMSNSVRDKFFRFISLLQSGKLINNLNSI